MKLRGRLFAQRDRRPWPSTKCHLIRSTQAAAWLGSETRHAGFDTVAAGNVRTHCVNHSAESSGQSSAPNAGSLAAITYVFATVMLGTTLPTPLYPTFEAEYGFGSLTTAMMFAIYAGGVITTLVLFGQASERYGRKPVLLVGVLLALLSAGIFLIANDLWVLIAGRIISGLSAGIFTATGTAAVLENAPKNQRTLASALATAANIGGLGLGILVAGLIAEWLPYPLRTPFAVHAGLLVLAGFALLAVRETVVPDRSSRVVRPPGIPRDARQVFWAASVGVIAGFAACGIYSALVPGFATEVLGVRGPAAIGLAVSVLFLASVVAQISLRSWSDRTLIAVGTAHFIVAMVFLAVALAATSLLALTLSSILAGIGQGLLFMAGLRAMMARTSAGERTQATTSYFVVVYLALSIPSVAAGLVTLQLSLTATGYISAAVIAAIAAMGLLNLRVFSSSGN